MAATVVGFKTPIKNWIKYINTTNMNPYTLQKTGGMGLGGISKRLQQLNVKPTKKSKNISFTL